jgi:hypothetical protein
VTNYTPSVVQFVVELTFFEKSRLKCHVSDSPCIRVRTRKTR